MSQKCACCQTECDEYGDPIVDITIDRQREEILELQRELAIEIGVRDACADQCGELREENKILRAKLDKATAALRSIATEPTYTEYQSYLKQLARTALEEIAG